MKKKLLLSLFLVLTFVCVFAVGVFAKDAYLEEIPSEWLYDGDTVSYFVVFEGEEYYTGGTEINGLNSDNIESQLSKLNIQTSEIGTKYLTKFVFPSTVNTNSVTYINFNSFKGHTYFSNVVGSIVLPSTITQVSDINERVGNLRHIDFGKDNGIAKIPYCFVNNALKLTKVDNFPTKNLQAIDGSAFNCCYYAFHDELVINATTVGAGAFNNAMSNVTGLVFGPNFNSAATQSFTVLIRELPSDLQTKVKEDGLALKYIEFQCDVTQLSSSFSVSPDATTTTGAFYFGPYNPTGQGNGRTAYDNLECIILSHEKNQDIKSGVTTFASYTGKNIYFKDLTGETEYVYTSHSYNAYNSCYQKCERCDKIVMKENPEHNFTNTFTDVNGNDISYLNTIYVHQKCTVCNTSVTSETIAPIFESLGYSVQEGEGALGAVTHKVRVNITALTRYQELSGITLKYGVVAGIKTETSTGTLVGIESDNVVSKENSLIADVTGTSYSILELKLTNIDKTIDVYCNAYVVSGSDITYIFGTSEAKNAIAQKVTL
ncbi:MAG: hypothetical protein J6A96_02440 [Clostridia bacterium]|nr:hypothetical protein [Clostridia bacterium]